MEIPNDLAITIAAKEQKILDKKRANESLKETEARIIKWNKYKNVVLVVGIILVTFCFVLGVIYGWFVTINSYTSYAPVVDSLAEKYCNDYFNETYVNFVSNNEAIIVGCEEHSFMLNIIGG